MDWKDLTDALRTDECVLLLGPNAATFDGESLGDLLTERIELKLRQRGIAATEAEKDLTAIVRRFMDAFRDEGTALDELRSVLRDFYSEFKDEPLPVYDAAAGLPFKYIINTAPQSLLLSALERKDKKARFFDFHFDNPEYNKQMNDRALDLEKEISEDTPLVFNLLGHYDRPDSLVLTDAARLRFLEVVLQREKEATLPANIAFFFNKRPVRRHRKAYIFAGFDFNEWHMRLFLHLLGSRHGSVLPQSITLQDSEALLGDAHTFFSDNFNMHFAGRDALGFFEQLKRELQQPLQAAPPARRELLLLYHPDDEDLRREMETYLAPLRHHNLVEIWHEEKILPGAVVKDVQREHLQSAQLIVPLLTANFLANDRLFTEILPEVLARHHAGSAKLAPILMTPCDVESTPLFELTTLQPKPRGKALSQKPDRAEALTNIVKDLRSMIERMNVNTQQTLPA